MVGEEGTENEWADVRIDFPRLAALAIPAVLAILAWHTVWQRRSNGHTWVQIWLASGLTALAMFRASVVLGVSEFWLVPLSQMSTAAGALAMGIAVRYLAPARERHDSSAHRRDWRWLGCPRCWRDWLAESYERFSRHLGFQRSASSGGSGGGRRELEDGAAEAGSAGEVDRRSHAMVPRPHL